jgi:threonine dehydratase
MKTLALDDVCAAAQRISELAERSPVVRAAGVSRLSGADAWLKLETVQPTGSFKVRGAANALLALEETGTSPRGVVTFSTGNHGRAVAFVGRKLGLPVTVCVAETVPEAKLAPLRASGAELRVEGETQDHAALIAREVAAEREFALIEPFDDPDVIAGQGTIGLELVEQLPELEVVLVPVSGCGLVSGIAVAIKALRPRTLVIGVCAANAPAMFDSIRAGRPVASAEQSTLADSLRGGIGTENRWTFELVRHHVDELVVVNEAQIERALMLALHDEALVLEGAAAVGIAALQSGLIRVRGRCTAIVASGRNGETLEVHG